MRRFLYPTHLTHKAARDNIKAAISGSAIVADLSRNDWFSLDGTTPDIVAAALHLQFILQSAP